MRVYVLKLPNKSIYQHVLKKCKKYCFKNKDLYLAFDEKEENIYVYLPEDENVNCFIECISKELFFRMNLLDEIRYEDNNEKLKFLKFIVIPNNNYRNVISAVINAFENKIGENPLCNYEKKHLVITDPYFLKFDRNDKILITDLFEALKNMLINLKKVILIIPSRNYDRDKFNELKDTFTNLGLELDLKIDNNKRGKGLFHDRFWIFFGGDTTNCCGLIVGTSLNGLGKKYALIENLSYEDALTIMEDIERLFGVS